MIKERGLLRFFQWICRWNFGDFKKEEFKKFLRMGLIFALIIGVYWALSPLKDAIFIMSLAPLQKAFRTLAGKSHYLMLSGVLCFPLLAS